MRPLQSAHTLFTGFARPFSLATAARSQEERPGQWPCPGPRVAFLAPECHRPRPRLPAVPETGAALGPWSALPPRTVAGSGPLSPTGAEAPLPRPTDRQAAVFIPPSRSLLLPDPAAPSRCWPAAARSPTGPSARLVTRRLAQVLEQSCGRPGKTLALQVGRPYNAPATSPRTA